VQKEFFGALSGHTLLNRIKPIHRNRKVNRITANSTILQLQAKLIVGEVRDSESHLKFTAIWNPGLCSELKLDC
jgi:hypothetical protein